MAKIARSALERGYGRTEVWTVVGLRSRIRKLESTYSFIAQCPACGFDDEWNEIEVEWDEGNTESEENEYCPECGGCYW